MAGCIKRSWIKQSTWDKAPFGCCLTGFHCTYLNIDQVIGNYTLGKALRPSSLDCFCLLLGQSDQSQGKETKNKKTFPFFGRWQKKKFLFSLDTFGSHSPVKRIGHKFFYCFLCLCPYTVKSRFNEWSPSAHFDSLNRDFSLKRDFLMWNSILVASFCTLNWDFMLVWDSLNWDSIVLSACSKYIQ